MDKQQRAKLKQDYKEREPQVGIYQIKNLLNGKVFVGSTLNLDGIFNRHRFQLNHGSHINKELQKDWNEAGADNFSFEVLERLKPDTEDKEKAVLALEQLWLEELKPYKPEGYNDHKAGK